MDTNILVSAFGWKGNPHRIFERIASGEIELFTCEEQSEELARVLEYPKFHFSEEQKTRFKQLVSVLATLVEIPGKLEIIKQDPSDNVIAECALTAQVDFLISGDPHLLNVKRIGRTRIVRASEFLGELNQS